MPFLRATSAAPTVDPMPAVDPVSASEPVPASELRWDSAPDDPEGVVLVMHGGKVRSERAARWGSLPVIRMLPISKSIARHGKGRLAVVRLRYAVRGWNGQSASPLRDAAATLDHISARYPGVPVALVGHSMGGRVALMLAGDPRVRAIVGLAPWIERTDHFPLPLGQRLLILHGLSDRITDPRASRLLVESLRAGGHIASFVGLARDKHAMVLRYRDWDELTNGFIEAALVPNATTTRPSELGAIASRATREGHVTLV